MSSPSASVSLEDHDDSPASLFLEGAYHHGNYATRMEELFDDGASDRSHEEDDDNFVYTGLDATNANMGYKDILRDVLGSELTDDDEMSPGIDRSAASSESPAEDSLVS